MSELTQQIAHAIHKRVQARSLLGKPANALATDLATVALMTTIATTGEDSKESADLTRLAFMTSTLGVAHVRAVAGVEYWRKKTAASAPSAAATKPTRKRA